MKFYCRYRKFYFILFEGRIVWVKLHLLVDVDTQFSTSFLHHINDYVFLHDSHLIWFISATTVFGQFQRIFNVEKFLTVQ